ncbi:MAG: hypothetical protein ACI9N9_000027 [Enterobacterales bacterium]|jgi:hypothetical protein
MSDYKISAYCLYMDHVPYPNSISLTRDELDVAADKARSQNPKDGKYVDFEVKAVMLTIEEL